MLQSCTEGNGPSLLGLTGCIILDWKEIAFIQVELLKSLNAKYSDIFSSDLGTIQGVSVDIRVDEDAKPRFYKTRSVPYSLKEKIEKELDRLVAQEIIQPVLFSEWAASIVPAVKEDGNIRICGDYKLTVNNVCAVDT